MDEEEWRQQHAENKLNKLNTRVESVVVATCGDDGTVRLWLPTVVSYFNFNYSFLPFQFFFILRQSYVDSVNVPSDC